MRRRDAAVAVAVLAAFVCAGCRQAAPAVRPDIVLVSIDTLRADRLGAYDSTTGATPELDRFRRRAVLLRTLVAQAPATLTSHASLFTSRIPQHHGAAFAARHPLPDTELTLAEALAAQGYRTRAYVAGGQMRREFGLAQGFERYKVMWEKSDRHVFERKVDAGLAELAADDPRPLFLFLHTYEVHHPYNPEPEILHRLDPGYDGPLGDRIEVATLSRINSGEMQIDEADARHIRAAYEAELVSVDAAFGRLARAVEKRDRRRPTILLFTSDHGEELGEHGRMGWHGHSLYDELLLVPGLLALPGGEARGREIDLPVRSIDLAPTLLALAGLPVPEPFEGRSLVPLLHGESLEEVPAVFQRSLFGSESGPADGIRWRGWKLHGRKLFDLRVDPGEKDDLSAKDPRMRQGLEQLLAEIAGGGVETARESLKLDDEAEAELRALGYLN